MRSPGAVYKKLKEVKYFYFVDIYKKAMKRTPNNCKFNYCYKFIGDGGVEKEIRLCLLHQPGLDLKGGITPHLIDVCEETHHVGNCNAFLPRYTKEELKDIFEQELLNKNIKQKRYPSILALEWVLERSAEVSPLTVFQKILLSLKKIFSRGK